MGAAGGMAGVSVVVACGFGGAGGLGVGAGGGGFGTGAGGGDTGTVGAVAVEGSGGRPFVESVSVAVSVGLVHPVRSTAKQAVNAICILNFIAGDNDGPPVAMATENRDSVLFRIS